jgi:putative transposase
MSKAQPIQLTDEQRAELEQIIRTGNAAARVQTRARILLLSSEGEDGDVGKSEAEIVAALHTSAATVQKTRRHFRLEGLHRALYDKPRPGRPPRITGEVEAKLTMLACSTPPQGRERWTLQLLADKMVELQYIDAISDQAVYKTLKKTNLSLG